MRIKRREGLERVIVGRRLERAEGWLCLVRPVVHSGVTIGVVAASDGARRGVAGADFRRRVGLSRLDDESDGSVEYWRARRAVVRVFEELGGEGSGDEPVCHSVW